MSSKIFIEEERADVRKEEKISKLLKTAVYKLQDVFAITADNVSKISELEQDLIAVSNRLSELERQLKEALAKQQQTEAILGSRKIQLEQERAKLIVQEDYQHINFEAEREPRLREEFKIYVDSSNPRLLSISNTSFPDFADFILMDSQKVDLLSMVDKNKVVVILSNTDNPAKYSSYNVIKDNYTEKQIFKVLSALHQNRLALQGYGSRKARDYDDYER